MDMVLHQIQKVPGNFVANPGRLVKVAIELPIPGKKTRRHTRPF
jgi:hypothetical protein